MRWALSTALGLIALQALVSRGGSGRVAQAFADANHLLERALDPTVPAIPDRSQRLAKAHGLRSNIASPDKTAATEQTTTPRLPVPGQMRAV